MARNSSNALDIEHALRRDLALCPPRDLRFINADFASDIDKPKVVLLQERSEPVRHHVAMLRNSQLMSSGRLRTMLTTVDGASGVMPSMTKVVHIHAGKQPKRPHHIVDWAELRNLRQADITVELGIDKSTVSRWFRGSTPVPEHQAALAALFGTTPEGLFRHPNEDWLSKFFEGRKQEEIDRAKAVLEAMFPKPITSPTKSGKTAT